MQPTFVLIAHNSKFPAIAAFSGIFGKQQLSLQRISFCSRRVKLTRQGWESAPGFKDTLSFYHIKGAATDEMPGRFFCA